MTEVVHDDGQREYRVTAAGWAAGFYRQAGEILPLNERAARYEPLLELVGPPAPAGEEPAVAPKGQRAPKASKRSA